MSIVGKLRILLKQLMVTRAKHGPYRYLIKNWRDISDLDLAVNVLGTDFFREELAPLPLPVSDLRSILVIAPHQDDEAIGAGGTLLLASQANVKIDILFFTDGAQDNGPVSVSEMIQIRHDEAEQVCHKLGATLHTLAVSNLQPVITRDHLELIADLVNQLKPQVIMLPWLLDSPPKHRLVNHTLWLVHQLKPLPDCEIWGYQVHNMLYPNGYVDITSVAAQKRELIQFYPSQNEYYQCYDHLAMGISAWNARILPVELGNVSPKYAEIFFTTPLYEYSELIQKFYFNNLECTYLGNHVVLEGIATLHRDIVGM